MQAAFFHWVQLRDSIRVPLGQSDYFTSDGYSLKLVSVYAPDKSGRASEGSFVPFVLVKPLHAVPGSARAAWEALVPMTAIRAMQALTAANAEVRPPESPTVAQVLPTGAHRGKTA